MISKFVRNMVQLRVSLHRPEVAEVARVVLRLLEGEPGHREALGAAIGRAELDAQPTQVPELQEKYFGLHGQELVEETG